MSETIVQHGAIDDSNSQLSSSQDHTKVYFPRCEYYTRYRTTSSFCMDDHEFWGTYYRSTTRGGNYDRYAKLVKEQKNNKTYDNKLTNKDSTSAKTGAFIHPFLNEYYKEIICTTLSKKKQALSLQEPLLYDEILSYKKNLCSNFSILSDLIIATYSNQYPCIIIKIKLFDLVQRNVECWYKVALSYFIKIVNQKAVDKNVPIELINRSSFGHNNPSVASTGESFRINIGLVPKIYISILQESLIELGNVITELSNATIDSTLLKEMNRRINLYNLTKPDNKKISTWGSNLFNTLNSIGDSSGKTVIFQITRMRYYSDLLTDYVKNTESISKPIEIILEKLKYENKISLKENVERGEFSFIELQNKLTFPAEINDEINSDLDFKDILKKIFKSLSSNEQLATFKMHSLYSDLEKLNINFIKNIGYDFSNIDNNISSGSESEDDYEDYLNDNNRSNGSESEGEFEFDKRKFYSKKLLLSTGMRAINFAAFISIYYATKNTNSKKIKFVTNQMYYETHDAVKNVINVFDLINFFDTKRDSNNEAIISFIDLNHCNTTYNESQTTFQSLALDNKHIPVILDYTSATTEEIRNAVLNCLKNTNLVLLVNSGLKNEQCGADINPYGTMKIYSNTQKLTCELHSLAKEALKRGNELLPKLSHRIRRSYKKAGYITTNNRLFQNFVNKKFNAKYEEEENKEIFKFWILFDHTDAISNLKLLDKSDEDILKFAENKAFIINFNYELENFEKDILKRNSKSFETLVLYFDYELKELIKWNEVKISSLGCYNAIMMMKNKENVEDLDDIKFHFNKDYEASIYIIENCIDFFEKKSFLNLLQEYDEMTGDDEDSWRDYIDVDELINPDLNENVE